MVRRATDRRGASQAQLDLIGQGLKDYLTAVASDQKDFKHLSFSKLCIETFKDLIFHNVRSR